MKFSYFQGQLHGFSSSSESYLKVKCPQCCAPKGSPCKGLAGQVIKNVHRQRANRFKECAGHKVNS